MSLKELLTGKSQDQLISFREGPYLIHNEVSSSLDSLFTAAQKDGIELAITSSYRSFADQKSLWNNKAQGLRAVLDRNSNPVDITKKSKVELLFLILRWSAIPGGSRHHWGTDLDVYDKSVMTPEYKIQLVPSEYETGGIFSRSNLWLTENMADYGFFRPYTKDRGGILPEPWHISYKPLSDYFLEELSFSVFEEHLSESDFLLLEEAQNFKADIYQRFIQIGQ